MKIIFEFTAQSGNVGAIEFIGAVNCEGEETRVAANLNWTYKASEADMKEAEAVVTQLIEGSGQIRVAGIDSKVVESRRDATRVGMHYVSTGQNSDPNHN